MANTVLKFQITLTETWFSTSSSSTWKLEQSTICSLLWVKVNNIEKRRRKRRRTHHCNSIFKFPWFNFSLSVHHTLSQKSATYFGISCFYRHFGCILHKSATSISRSETGSCIIIKASNIKIHTRERGEIAKMIQQRELIYGILRAKANILQILNRGHNERFHYKCCLLAFMFFAVSLFCEPTLCK